jgi:hypothetical protein
MAYVLHLLPRAGAPLAATMIHKDLEAGDDVAVALLADGGPGAEPGQALPHGARLHRVPTDWSYEQLLEQIFAADRVVTW